ncbi:hypothetical protein B0H14DRAFT_3142295 [Mycena olivaceomarginata]|nr:hypothetical protein B0H14DRAFT_3142295 [Mycena olivaceomarginata]
MALGASAVVMSPKLQRMLTTPTFAKTVITSNPRGAGKVKNGPSSTSQLEASVSDAEVETSAGLRPNAKKRKSSSTKTDTEAASVLIKAKSANKGKNLRSLGRAVAIQKVIFLPDGMNLKGELNRARLSISYVDHLLEFGLAKLSTPAEPISFHQGDSNEEICSFVEGHFPRAIG